eukprot:TRINITY_DN5174_c0_g1_i2.p1 TRINITY_DN5174_c0_g1~~TRINITY_DN5174_c0_g1_i2.p1  ORF type:complete len:200 (-),score=18.37 TRINITY_DN5174_c0_g1_i2:114-713(-)
MATSRASALCLLLLLVPLAATPRGAHGATVGEVVSELKALQTAMNDHAPSYTIMSIAFGYVIQQLEKLPQGVSSKRFSNRTLLIPTNSAFTSFTALPTTPVGWLKLASIPTLNALKGRLSFDYLKGLPDGTKLKLSFPNKVLLKETVSRSFLDKLLKRGTTVALGRPKKLKASWGKIMDSDLYQGKVFFAQGVNNIQQY